MSRLDSVDIVNLAAAKHSRPRVDRSTAHSELHQQRIHRPASAYLFIPGIHALWWPRDVRWVDRARVAEVPGA